MSSESDEKYLPAILRKAHAIQTGKQSTPDINQYAQPVRFEVLANQHEVSREKAGFVLTARELRAMEKDMAVCAYEPIQNLSYGLGGNVKPGIVFGLKDGGRMLFDGISQDAPPYENVSYISYVTAVPEGITPSTATLPIHRDQEGGSALGVFGLGMKHTSLFLTAKFPETAIEITSAYTHGKTNKRIGWVGRYTLADTTDGTDQQLAIDFVETATSSDQQTLMTVFQPPQEYYRATVESPRTFLFMDPNYRGGLFVPGNGDFQGGVKYQALVGGLCMEVLDLTGQGRKTDDQQAKYYGGFIDGLQFRTTETQSTYERGGYFLHPWHFLGGHDSNTEYYAQIKRGTDSAKVEGLHKMPDVLRHATNNGDLNSKFWKSTFEKIAKGGGATKIAQGTGAKEVGAYELGESYYTFDPKGLETLQVALRQFLEIHPEIVAIARDTKEVAATYERVHNLGIDIDGQALLLGGLYTEVEAVADRTRIPPLSRLAETKTKEALTKAPPIATYIEKVVKEVDSKTMVSTEQALMLLGEDYKTVALEFNRDDKKIIFVFGGSAVNPLMTPEAVNLALLSSNPLFQLITSVMESSEVDQRRLIEILRSDSLGELGIEIKLSLQLKLTPGKFVWIVNGDARKTASSPPSAKLTFEIPIDPAKFAEFSKFAEVCFEKGKIAKIHREAEAQRNNTAQEMQIREQQSAIEALKRENQQLQLAIENDPALKKDKAVQAALAKARAREEEVKELKRKLGIKGKEELRLRLDQLAALRGEVWKIGSRVAVGVGAFVVSKEILLPWLIQNDTLQNGLLIVGSEINAIRQGLHIPTILGDHEVVQISDRGMGLSWSASDSLYIDADNEPTTVNPRNFLEGWKQEGYINPESGEARREIYYKMHPLVTLEGQTPGTDTSGYFFTSYANRLVLQKSSDGGLVKGDYYGGAEYQERQLQNSRPRKYLLRQTYTPQMDERVWTPISPRVGEMPIAFAGVEGAEFRQNMTTGVWEVKMRKENSSSLIVYTGEADEEALSFLKREPDERDLEPLLELNALRPDIRTAVQAIKDDQTLAQDEKTEEALAVFRATMKYDRVAPKDNFPQSNTLEYVSAMINQGIGPCGYFSLGATAVLRAVGTPCNSVGGYINEAFGEELDPTESHGWNLVWNFKAQKWQYMEPQVGITTERYKQEKEGLSVITTVETDTASRTTQPNELPASVDFHLIDKPEPKYASLIDSIQEITSLDQSTLNLPGLDTVTEDMIFERLRADETRSQVSQIMGQVAQIAATIAAPTLVKLVRQTITTKRQIREEVDQELKQEEEQAN